MERRTGSCNPACEKSLYTKSPLGRRRWGAITEKGVGACSVTITVTPEAPAPAEVLKLVVAMAAVLRMYSNR